MTLSFVLYFSSTNGLFTIFVINIGFKMKVSGLDKGVGGVILVVERYQYNFQQYFS